VLDLELTRHTPRETIPDKVFARPDSGKGGK
jgi:hypothetical protein